MSGLGVAQPKPQPQPMTPAETMQSKDGTVVTIDAETGEVYFDAPRPAVIRKPNKEKFGENLAETLPDGVLNTISNDYLDGVNADILSRQDFIQNRNKGIDLLGLKLDDASSIRSNRQSISRIKNPSLLKACMRSQSMSRGQLLPAEGPAKIQTISGESDGEDEMAKDFGQDFNYFLTHVDKGYYADTDRMLFYRAFEGSGYKKVYRDAVMGMPTSRFVSMENLIVSEDASSLSDALRKTHELLYNPVQLKRMQAMGGWLDVDLGQPMQNLSPSRRKVLESQGLSPVSTRGQDISYTIYEGYWHFSPGDYGWEDPLADTDIPAPYRLVMDRDSRKVLALHRNWKKRDERFREREVFVKYGLVPGLGFLDYGFLHLIGNQTRVLTAIWQILVDKGMLANFPGGMKVKGVRTSTNELNPGLGEWVEVDIGSADDIRKALMAMPYGEISQVFLSFAEQIQKDVDGLSGTLEIPTGQGTTNTPVGTILAIIEQQAQDLTAVQQRDHRSQEEELRLLRDLFIENPEDLVHLKRKGSSRDWKALLTEFSDMDLVPASDPNIPSQAHRILINQFLLTLAEKAPTLFGSRLQKVASRIMRSIGINDAEDLLAPPAEFLQSLKAQQQGGKQAPGAAAAQKAQMELPLKQAELQLEQEKVGLLKQDTQRKAANEAGQQQLDEQKAEAEIAKTHADILHDQATLASDHSLGVAGLQQDGAADPQAAADLKKTNAQAFAAIGTGAMGLAKAEETVQQGARDAAAIENDETPPSETKDASLAGPAPAAPKTTLQGSAAKPRKARAPKAKG